MGNQSQRQHKCRDKRTHVFAKVLNLNDRSIAAPSWLSTHRPPEVASNGVAAAVKAFSSEPAENRRRHVEKVAAAVMVAEDGMHTYADGRVGSLWVGAVMLSRCIGALSGDKNMVSLFILPRLRLALCQLEMKTTVDGSLRPSALHQTLQLSPCDIT
jgi:hypothetical protein